MSATQTDAAQPAKDSIFSVIATDMLAGITTGVLSLPQGIAFAVIANIPPQYGLYAMIIPTIVSAILRNSPFLITGATNTSALVIGGLLATLPAIANHTEDPVRVMLLITLIMGIIQVLAGALRLGGIGRYVSKAVLVGFTLGAAALILSGQLKNVLGLKCNSSVLLLDELSNLAAQLHTFNPRALAVAAVTLLVICGCARISRLVPGALLGIVAAAGLVQALGWNKSPGEVAMLGEVPRALPAFTLPAFSVQLFEDVLGPSIAIAVLGMVEAISIGKAVSARARVRFHANQELAAKGAGNVAGAFFGCMPTSASWTRSVVNMQMGARTRWAGAMAGVTVLVFVIALAPWARYIPRAALGAVIIWIAVYMIDFGAIRRVWRWSRRDAAVMLITVLAILFLEIQHAIYIGIAASMIVLLHNAGQLHMSELIETGLNQFREVEIGADTGRSPLVLLQLEGDLFSGVVDELETRLDQIISNGARVIVIRLKRTHGVDATTMEALASFVAHYKARGGRLLICGLKPDMFARFSKSELAAVIGPENLLPANANNFASVRQALELGRRHLGQETPAASAEGDFTYCI